MATDIGPAAAHEMSDDDWLRVIARYDASTDEHFLGELGEASATFAKAAKTEPERFAQLALRIDHPGGHYLPTLISAIGSDLAMTQLVDICVHARAVCGEGVGREICFAIRESSDTIDDRLVDLVQEVSNDSDPETEVVRTESQNGEFYLGGDLVSAGLSSNRGVAAYTIGKLIWDRPQLVEMFLEDIQRLVADEVLAVRVLTAEALRAMIGSGVDGALSLARSYFAGPSDLMDYSDSHRLLLLCLREDFGNFEQYLEAALGSDSDAAAHAGAVWAISVANGSLAADRFPITEMPTTAREGVADLLARNPELLPAVLDQLFDDSSDEVRGKASYATYKIVGEDESPTNAETIRSFLGSAAFDEKHDAAIYVLTRTTLVLPEVAVDACERIIDGSGADLGDIRTSAAAYSGDLVSIVTRLYRQGSPGIRERCLDMIDKLCSYGGIGLHQALDADR